MDHAGIETVDEIRLAGAFGSQIDPFHAMVLGLIPDAPLDHVKAAGNAAGTGALIALAQRAPRGARSRTSSRTRREDRDRGRAAVPGALRRRDGVPPPDGAVPEPVGRRRPAPTDRRRRRPAAEAASLDDAVAPRRPQRVNPHPRGTTDDRRPLPDSAPAAATPAARPASTPSSTGEPFLTRTLAPFEVLGEEGLAIIEHNADTILEEVGLEFRGDAGALGAPEGRRRRRDQGERVRFPRGLCPPDRPGDRAARSSPSTPGTRRTTSRSAGCTPSSPRTTARRSSATSTTAGATARSRTSGTS